MTTPFATKSPKKLIEVALPLDDVNEQAAREKSIRHGHPSTLHLWWARRPLAAARAVLFAQLVNDPSWKWEMEHPGAVPPNHLKASWASSRKRLFDLLTELSKWENTTNERLLERARCEIRRSWREVCEINQDHPDAATLFNPNRMPGVHDPFAGGGTIPLEAQRLGLEAYASDLNQVAVLINKAMIEIPAKFAALPPVHPSAKHEAMLTTWQGAQGLAVDVQHYGSWLRSEAESRIGHLYPRMRVTREMAADRSELSGHVGQNLTVIAWLWARTVKSPNPAFSHRDVPLVSSFILATRSNNEAWIEPVISGDVYRFRVRKGTIPPAASAGTKARGRGADFRCILSGVPIEAGYIREQAKEGRMGSRLLAVVADGGRSRIYLDPTDEQQAIATQARPEWKPDVKFFEKALGFRIGNYGMTCWSDVFTSRQLIALTTLSGLVDEARNRAHSDALAAGRPGDGVNLEHGGLGAAAYADAIAVYLALAVSKVADYNSSLVAWSPTRSQAKTTFSRHALSMIWDFAEINIFARAAGDFETSLSGIQRTLATFVGEPPGDVRQSDAQDGVVEALHWISTDPPYYDNIGYADLSDFFYVWLRRALRPAMPRLFAAMTTPKGAELVATPGRHECRQSAETFFLGGMTTVMKRLVRQAHPGAPVTIFYAFKQSETARGGGTSSSGWETFLGALISAGFAITGTWPMRTERSMRTRSLGSNALASSIVLVCRIRPSSAQTASRREFLRVLNSVLPEALDEMTRGADEDRSPVAPVDLSQAIIGPGMAVFSKYAAVLEADGTPMSVKTALQLINRFLAEDDFDTDTQFCLHWFDQHGWEDGAFGDADVLARAKATSVGGIESAGVLISGSGRVRLRRPAEYPEEWDPRTDKRLPIWEVLHQLIRAFRAEGETGAGEILGVVKNRAEAVRQLAYRLYTLCERRGWAEDARAYNELVTSWTAIETIANTVPEPAAQLKLFGGS